MINQKNADFVPRPAVNAVLNAGGIPVGLPYLPDDRVGFLLDKLDGIIFTGGPDIDPTFMDEEPIPELGRTDRYRDSFEIALAKGAVTRNMPILGICRGAELINIALGGTIYQDLGVQYAGKLIKHHQAAPGDLPTHHVEVFDSFLRSSVGSNPFVNSRHHQAIKEVAPNLKVVAKAPDGVIEAIENKDASIQAVQWHPENMWEKSTSQFSLFKDYIDRI